MAAELQVRAPGAGPWSLAWLAATLAAEALTAPLLLPLVPTWLRLLAAVVAIVSPLAIAVAVVFCRRQAQREPVTRSDVMSIFLGTGLGALAGLPLLIVAGVGVIGLFQSAPTGLPQALGVMLLFAVLAEMVGFVLGLIPAVVLALLTGWIVSRVAFRPNRHPRACPEDP